MGFAWVRGSTTTTTTTNNLKCLDAMGSGAGLGLAMVKLILLVSNAAFFLVNLLLAIVFGWKVVAVTTFTGVIQIIQLSLIGLCFVFLFGVIITVKRKFFLLKLYTVILGVFVIAQIGAVSMFFIDPDLSDQFAGPVYSNLCDAVIQAEDGVANVGSRVSAVAGKVPWICCCPTQERCNDVNNTYVSTPFCKGTPLNDGYLNSGYYPKDAVEGHAAVAGNSAASCAAADGASENVTAACGAVTALDDDTACGAATNCTYTAAGGGFRAAVPAVGCQAALGKDGCTKRWIDDHLEVFLSIMTGVLFFEMLMVVGTLKLSMVRPLSSPLQARSRAARHCPVTFGSLACCTCAATPQPSEACCVSLQNIDGGEGKWYSPSEPLDEGAAGADQLNQYLGDFK